ncbi:hypothetical protein FSARC_5728 [Fusarium sarcochroum]|uniref:Zn(2)-C6 fungal-type domain-containing protein n=1 Tax=Fusarium sarcochroum TaxID=1208366 RepID=A0A8H4TZ47_9HYPO|nr:hypothetical protein FSARC_5728 [Fusarium sarcochroum]
MSSVTSQPQSQGVKRRRARKACAECNRRKVRCDLSDVGLPCTNCLDDGVVCDIPHRKKRSARSKVNSEPIGEASRLEANASLPVADSVPVVAEEQADDSGEDGDNAGALAAAVQDETGQGNEEGTIYYTGNQHGAVSFVADLVAGDEQSPHYLVPHKVRKHKSPEDLEYLRIKGVFSVPPKEVCDALIRTYFFHVHPLLPILDATSFLTQFAQHGYESVNLLLLWSMVLVAAGFEELDVLAKAGYASRKALKRAAYERAKLLYDNAYDDDQITLIQSVILIGHWHADAEDRFEAWHWTGIAISLCQTAGLHCAPTRSARKSLAFNESRERLCRRIWWTCVCRDRWLSMIKGRPLRIRLEDGDVSPASIQDMEHDLGQLPEAIKIAYFPFDIQRVCRFWIKSVEISLLLGTIVLKTAGLAEATEAHLSACDWPEEEIDNMHPCEKLCAYHNRLLYCATCVAFWRARVVSSPRDEQLPDPGRAKATGKARAAAIRSNSVLEEILSHGLLRYMKSQSISALVPPMQIHLLDCKSSITSVRVLGTNRLQLCMQILVELKETYWAAEFALKLFERAYERILRQSKRGESSTSLLGDSRSQPVQTVAVPPLQDLSTPSSDSFLSADEIFMPGYDFGGYSGMDLLWK